MGSTIKCQTKLGSSHINEVGCNRIIGENDLAEVPMSSVQGSVSPMAITPSAITKWIGAVAQISRMLRRIPFQWRTLSG